MFANVNSKPFIKWHSDSETMIKCHRPKVCALNHWKTRENGRLFGIPSNWLFPMNKTQNRNRNGNEETIVSVRQLKTRHFAKGYWRANLHWVLCIGLSLSQWFGMLLNLASKCDKTCILQKLFGICLVRQCSCLLVPQNELYTIFGFQARHEVKSVFVTFGHQMDERERGRLWDRKSDRLTF